MSMNDGYRAATVTGHEGCLYFVDEVIHCEHVQKLVKWFDAGSSELLQRAAGIHGIEFQREKRQFETVSKFGNWYLSLLARRISEIGVNPDREELFKIAVVLNGPGDKEEIKNELKELSINFPDRYLNIDTRPYRRVNSLKLTPKMKDRLQVKEHADRKEDRFSESEIEYIYSLIRYRNSFRVFEVIPLVERFGKKYISELYTLIAANYVATNIYKKVLTENEFWFGQDGFRFLDNTLRCRVNTLDGSRCRVELWELEKNKTLILKFKYDVFGGGDLIATSKP
ncbi:MAG: hypothetical protein ACOCQC_00030 [Halanaerobiaceae bacterium]